MFTFFNALHYMQRGLGYLKAVCPSIKRVNCVKVNESSAHIVIPYERRRCIVFRHENGWWGRSLLPEILGQIASPWKRRLRIDIRSYHLSRSTLHSCSEKSSMMINRKSNTGFPMSLRWTVYVVSKHPKGAQKCKSERFSHKGVHNSKNVCYKVSECENFPAAKL